MQSLLNGLIRLSRMAVAAAFLVLMGAVLIQVLGRSVFADSPVWTEELTRYALLFLAAFGAGLSYRSGDLVNVNILSAALPENWQRGLEAFAAAATALLCGALILPAWQYTAIGAMQTSPALGWRMDLIHVSVLILLLSLLLFSLLHFWQAITGNTTANPSAQENDV
ncbi:MAG: TRAP transporter small permease subunit [Thiolinea sp.]